MVESDIETATRKKSMLQIQNVNIGRLQGPVQPLFQCVMQRLSGQDQDQEVKECAISCMASIISCLGDVLLPEVPQALRVSDSPSVIVLLNSSRSMLNT